MINNPLFYIDPTGFKMYCADGICSPDPALGYRQDYLQMVTSQGGNNLLDGVRPGNQGWDPPYYPDIPKDINIWLNKKLDLFSDFTDEITDVGCNRDWIYEDVVEEYYGSWDALYDSASDCIIYGGEVCNNPYYPNGIFNVSPPYIEVVAGDIADNSQNIAFYFLLRELGAETDVSQYPENYDSLWLDALTTDQQIVEEAKRKAYLYILDAASMKGLDVAEYLDYLDRIDTGGIE